MKLINFFMGFIALLGLPYIYGQSLNEFEEEFIKIIQKVKSCVVKIKVAYKQRGACRETSGIIMDKEGHIVTIAGAFKNFDTIHVYLSCDDKITKLTADFIGADAHTNLAILRVKSENLPYVEKGFSEKLRVGAFLITVGNPYGLKNSVSTGIVSGLNRCVWGRNSDRPLTGLIQTTAPINPGDDGGLVVDSRGKFVGMAFSTLRRNYTKDEFFISLLQKLQKENLYSKKSLDSIFQYLHSHSESHEWAVSSSNLLTSQGINFVFPSEAIYWVAEQIIKHSEVKRGWVGITVKDSDSGQGVIITKIMPGSPASKSPIKVGDMLSSIDNHPVTDCYSLLHRTSYLLADQKIEITFSRNQEKSTVFIQLEPLPCKARDSNSK